MHTIRHILQIKGNYVWSITPDSTVFDALRLMADKGIGALVVMKDDELVGILSERDYARKIILHGKTSRDTLVSEVMTEEVFTIHPDQTTHECMELLAEKHIRHVPVTMEDKVVGVISIGDIVNDIIYLQKETIKSLENQLLSKNELM